MNLIRALLWILGRTKLKFTRCSPASFSLPFLGFIVLSSFFYQLIVLSRIWFCLSTMEVLRRRNRGFVNNLWVSVYSCRSVLDSSLPNRYKLAFIQRHSRLYNHDPSFNFPVGDSSPIKKVRLHPLSIILTISAMISLSFSTTWLRLMFTKIWSDLISGTS